MAPLLKLRNKLVYPGGQPGFNPAHPASQKLLLSAVAIPGAAANFYNIKTGAKGTPSSVTPTGPIFAGLGPTMNLSTDDDVTFSGTYSTSGSIGYTISSIFAIRGNNGSGGSYLFEDSASFNNGLRFEVGGGGNLSIEPSGNTFTTSGLGISANNGPQNTPFFLAWSHWSNGLDIVVARNLITGQVTTYSANNGIGLTSGDGNFYIGNRGIGNVRYFNGYIAATSYSGVPLNLSQLLQWSESPWDFWYPNQFDLAESLHGTFGGGATTALRFNASLNGLGSSGPFFHDRIAN